MDTAPFNSVQQLHDQTGLTEVRVVDDYTIELVTEKPTVNMLYWLEEAFIAAPKYITDTAPDVVAQAPVGAIDRQIRAVEAAENQIAAAILARQVR